MIDEKVRNTAEKALTNEDLWSAVDQSKSQFLDVGYFFSHIVLSDASKYYETVEAMRRLMEEIQKLGRRSEFLVRSTWEITEVEFAGPYYGRDGKLRASSSVLAHLRSGSHTHILNVSVGYLASLVLQEQTGADDDDYEKHKSDMADAVRKLLELLLAGTGTSGAWDPLWHDEDLKITADTVRWMASQSVRHEVTVEGSACSKG